jgi:hypothetical protein
MRNNILFLFLFLMVPVWAAASIHLDFGVQYISLQGETPMESAAALPEVAWLQGMPVSGPAAAAQDTGKITELRERFDNGDAFTAFMTHEYVDSFTSDTVVTTGTIWIGTDSYKVVTDQQLVTVDGSVSKVYNRLQNKLIISFYDPEEDDFAPSRFLAGTQDRYLVQEAADDEGAVITLSSDDPFEMFREVRIHLNGKGIPWLISGIDQTDNEFSTWFESGVFIPATDDLFDISWPGSAEVVDLRN